MKKNFKERIIEKVNMRLVAELILDKLEDQIVEKVELSVDEEAIAKDFIEAYEFELIDTAVEIIEEEIMDQLSYEDVEGEFKDLVKEEVFS